MVVDSILTPIAVYIYHRINPSFEFLLPVHVIGISKESKYYYPINFWTQTYCYGLMFHFVFVDFLIFLTITSHILTELKGINEICKDLGKYEEYLSEKLFKRECAKNNDVEVIELPNDRSYIASNVLLKQVFERHTKVLGVINIASSFYFFNILLNEGVTFACNGFVYLVVTVFGDNYIVAMGACFIIPLYFMISLIGSKILEAEHEMARTLYASNWLYLKPKERKMLCVVLAVAQKPHTLSAGGFASVSLERFTMV